MNTRLDRIDDTHEHIVHTFACTCRATTRLERAEMARETHYASVFVVELCTWHRWLHEEVERWLGRSLALPLWIVEDAWFRCRTEGCIEMIHGLRVEEQIPLRYHLFRYYVPVCQRHQGVPAEWVPWNPRLDSEPLR